MIGYRRIVTLTFTFDHAGKRTTKVGKVTINSVPSGSTVTAVCPKGCAKKKLVKRNVSGSVSVTQLTGKKPLKVKTKITVTISNGGTAVQPFQTAFNNSSRNYIITGAAD